MSEEYLRSDSRVVQNVQVVKPQKGDGIINVEANRKSLNEVGTSLNRPRVGCEV